MWSNILGVILATLGAIDVQFGTGLMVNPLVQTIIAVLFALGISGRISATTKLTK